MTTGCSSQPWVEVILDYGGLHLLHPLHRCLLSSWPNHERLIGLSPIRMGIAMRILIVSSQMTDFFIFKNFYIKEFLESFHCKQIVLMAPIRRSNWKNIKTSGLAWNTPLTELKSRQKSLKLQSPWPHQGLSRDSGATKSNHLRLKRN